MSRTASSFAGRSGACVFLVLMAVACGTSDTPSDTSSAVAAPPAGTTYLTTEFVPKLEVTVPAWLPHEPSADEPNFLTWIGEGVWVDRAVRFLVPVNLYEPGSATASAPPANYLAYLAYLRTQDQHGAQFTDETTVTVGGRPATVMTATTTTSLDGSLGCPADGIPAAGCFGLQPELTLRIAIIDATNTTLLAWARAITGTADAAQEFDDFERMLANLQFR
jgi:hypothetical protein